MHQSHAKFFQERSNAGIDHIVRHEGEHDGPHVAIFGGIHGNERGGVEASVEVMRAIEESRLKIAKGSVSFILGNPEAYLQNMRFLDENLNRTFIEGPQRDNIEGNRSREIMHYMWQIRDDLAAVMDLHSVSVGDMQAVVYNNAKHFPEWLPPIYDFYMRYSRRHIAGMLPDLTSRYDVSGFLIEAGNHQSNEAVFRSLFHIRELFKEFGIETVGEMPYGQELDEKVIREAPSVHYKTIAQIDPSKGFRFSRDVETHMKLNAGEVFAHNDDGEIVAPQDCIIVMPDANPNPNDSDAGFLCVEVAA